MSLHQLHEELKALHGERANIIRQLNAKQVSFTAMPLYGDTKKLRELRDRISDIEERIVELDNQRDAELKRQTELANAIKELKAGGTL